MLTLDEIKRRLKDANLSKVAKASGLHYNTIYRLVNGQEPKYDTVKKLSDYLEQ